MKPVIIYYSYEGSCAFVAESLKDAFNAVSPGAELFSIKTADNTKRGDLVKYLWGGSQVLFGKNPELLPLGADINACDLVVLGTPVWAASPAPALVSFLERADIRGKKIALFCCHSGGKGKVFEKLKRLLPGNSFVGEIDFIDPRASGRDALDRKLGEWIGTFGN